MTYGGTLFAAYYNAHKYKDVAYLISPLRVGGLPTYIGTGVMSAQDDLSFELEFKTDGFEPYTKIFDAYKGESYNTTRLITGTNGGLLAYVNVLANSGGVSIPRSTYQTDFAVVAFTQTLATYNNTYTYNGTVSKGEPYDGEITMLNSSKSIHKYLKYLKIYKSSALVRHFVPRVRLYDSKPGMYDLCGSICELTNSPFYVNSGTGADFLWGELS